MPNTSRGNLYLIGFSGTGKTISGTKAAEKLQLPFVDMDELIEYRVGKSISEIFETDGEPAFRQMETDLLTELSTKPSRVVSTGGGVPTIARNREIMSSSGIIVLLTAEIETLRERLESTTSKGRNVRPLIGTEVNTAHIESMLEQRSYAYGCANGTVATDGKSHAEVGKAVAQIWVKLRSQTPAPDAQ